MRLFVSFFLVLSFGACAAPQSYLRALPGVSISHLNADFEYAVKDVCKSAERQYMERDGTLPKGSPCHPKMLPRVNSGLQQDGSVLVCRIGVEPSKGQKEEAIARYKLYYKTMERVAPLEYFTTGYGTYHVCVLVTRSQ